MKKTIVILLATLIALPASITLNAAEMSENVVTADAKPKKKGEVKEVVFSVLLDCENCVKKVQENIAFEKGVKDMKVSLEDQTVALKYDASKTSEATLKAAIEKLGYPVSGTLEPVQEHHHDHGHDHHHDHDHDHAH